MIAPAWRAHLAELLGTFLLLFGTGSVAAAVLTGAQVVLWQVAVHAGQYRYAVISLTAEFLDRVVVGELLRGGWMRRAKA